ncbi:hypothetical protein [Nitrosococcus wardiae]|uniref:Uncharacterized protein n=1 Tax=Nitrosococcus wardiae TaxID=1814290 RepID=A0A4P7BXU7_9GAMM|nr:hypothetical protein [Nitrosococcus wardiae]QBQ53216.1 hypothetical protein E3U44_00895 [Nitrosococcus wardiae]
MNGKQPHLEQRRPGTIFLSFFLAIASGTALVSYLSTVTGVRKLSLEQQMMLETLTWSEIGVTLFINIAILAAALLLYLHRRLALYFFLGAIGASLGKLGLTAFNKGSLVAIFSSELGGGALILGILVGACAYTWRLGRSGLLD